MDLRLQPATGKDLPLIQQWLEHNRLPTVDIPSVLDQLFLAYSASDNFKDNSESEVVGIGGIEIYGKHGLLRSLVLTESLRGNGYGQMLCQRLIETARAKGVQELYLLTNTAAPFFEKLGFAKVDRQSAPDSLQKTGEFSQLCPASATCMKLVMGNG